jgi:hypothetical protein
VNSTPDFADADPTDQVAAMSDALDQLTDRIVAGLPAPTERPVVPTT